MRCSINIALVSALVMYQFTDEVNARHKHKPITYTLVLVRHGESEANAAKVATGWRDAKLTDKGKKEAEHAGTVLKDAGYTFDVAFTSVLKRTKETLKIILDQLQQSQSIPVFETWHLNERHWGAFTNFSRLQLEEKYGKDEVTNYKRKVPPPLVEGHPLYEEISNSPLYRDVPDKEDIPNTESFQSMRERTIPYWEENIIPQIKSGKRVLIVGHKINIIGLVMQLEDMSEDDMMKMNFPNAVPLIYTLDENLKPISHQFVGDSESVARAEKMTAVLRQRENKP